MIIFFKELDKEIGIKC